MDRGFVYKGSIIDACILDNLPSNVQLMSIWRNLCNDTFMEWNPETWKVVALKLQTCIGIMSLASLHIT